MSETNKRLKFAIVGAGTISTSHALAITKNPNAELAAIVDFEQDRAKALAEKFDVKRTYKDYEEMCKQADIDVVCICVPSGLHGDITVATAQSGKHVLCEKPLEITQAKMEQMIAAGRANNVKLGVVFQARTMPASIAVYQAIQAGNFGRLVLAAAYLKYYRSQDYYNSAGWRGTWAMDGGGALMNQGVHGVDLIQWLAGGVESVFAYSKALAREIEVEDTAVAVVKYKNGAFGVIQCATTVYPARDARFEIHGEQGTVSFTGLGGVDEWSFMDNEAISSLVENGKNNVQQGSEVKTGHVALIDDMIQAIREDREPMINGEEAKKSVDIILAIYESSRTGKEVVVLK